MKEKIKEDFIEAYKNKNEIKKNVLGVIKTNISLLEKEKTNVTDIDVFNIIQKELKKTDATLNVQGLKPELLEIAMKEKNILESYLPEKKDTEELIKEIQELLLSNKLDKNIGSIMKYTKEKYSIGVDSKELSLRLKEIL